MRGFWEFLGKEFVSFTMKILVWNPLGFNYQKGNRNEGFNKEGWMSGSAACEMGARLSGGPDVPR